MKLETLSPEIVKLLTNRLSNEYSAHYLYQHLSNWCENEGYLVAAEFFKNESDDELSHARKLQKFMTDWNALPNLPIVESPKSKPSVLADCINLGYTAELDLYELYEETSNKVLKIGDTCVFDFLMFFRDVQQKSVAEYATKINMLNGIDVNNKFQMLSIEKKLF